MWVRLKEPQEFTVYELRVFLHLVGFRDFGV